MIPSLSLTQRIGAQGNARTKTLILILTLTPILIQLLEKNVTLAEKEHVQNGITQQKMSQM